MGWERHLKLPTTTHTSTVAHCQYIEHQEEVINGTLLNHWKRYLVWGVRGTRLKQLQLLPFFRKNVWGIGCRITLREKSKRSQQHTLTSIITTSAQDFHKHGDEKPPFRPEHPAIKLTTPRGMFSALAPRGQESSLLFVMALFKEFAAFQTGLGWKSWESTVIFYLLEEMSLIKQRGWPPCGDWRYSGFRFSFSFNHLTQNGQSTMVWIYTA